MLYYDRIDVFERTDINKTSASKECDISHYLNFLNYSFMFQSNVCNRCRDMLMMSVNINDIAIIEAVTLEQNADLIKKCGTL